MGFKLCFLDRNQCACGYECARVYVGVWHCPGGFLGGFSGFLFGFML